MQSLGKISLAIIHTSIELGSKVKNFKRIREMMNSIRENVDVVVVPSMINGLPLSLQYIKKLKMKSTPERIPGDTSKFFSDLSLEFNKKFVVGPILERKGTKAYISSLYVVPSIGLKNIVRHYEVNDGLLRTSDLPIIVDENLKICVLYGRDILLPEISVVSYLMGVDVAIMFTELGYEFRKYHPLLIARALELNSVVVMVGSIVKRKGEIIAQNPTIVMDEEGNQISEITEEESRILIIDIDLKSKKHIDYSRRNLLKKLRKLLSYELSSSQP